MLLAIVFFGLIVRLVYLQLVQGERYTFLSENNRVRLKRVPGTRGMIYDRHGELLVDSRPSFDLIFVPEDTTEPEQTLRVLADRLLSADADELLQTYEDNKSRSAFDEIVLGRDIEWSAVVAVETHQLDLPGVSLRIRPRRNYVDGPTTAHILGYMGEINDRQLKNYKEQGYLIGDEIGQSGLERRWEEDLRGQHGGQQVEVDALGRRVRVLHEVSDVPGYTVHLTLDRQMQQTAFEALKGKEGTIVAIDVNSGAILALASTPAFDPNVFARGIKGNEWNALITDRLRPLSNRATQGQFPPGSTFKVVMFIAGLEEGVVDPNAQISDPGFFHFGNRNFRDWKQGGHGLVNLHHALVISCDTYYYQLGNEARRRQDRQMGARLRPRREDWNCLGRRAGRHDSRYCVEDETLPPTLVPRRNPVGRHRPRLCDGDAVANGQHDGRGGQRRQALSAALGQQGRIPRWIRRA